MRVVDVEGAGVVPLTLYGSRRADVVSVGRLGDGAFAVRIRLAAGGRVGRHPATQRQLFWVVDGSGWASGADGVAVPIAAGQAALFEPGEEHECGTETGLAAVVLEGEGLDLAL